METERKMENEDVIDLGALFWAFLRQLKKAWWILPIFALIAAAAGCIGTELSYVPMYRSDASFTVVTESGTDGEFSFIYNNQTAGQIGTTFPYIVSSNLFIDAIMEDLGTDEINGEISASVIPDSNLVTLSVISTDAEDARTILESALRIYPEVSRYVIGTTRFNMIELPTNPQEPYNQPDYVRTALMWGLGGLAAALVLLAVGAYLKKTVQTTDELGLDMNLQCLGNVPEVRFKARGSQQSRDVSCLSKNIPESFKESIQSLWLRVSREMEKNGWKVLLITSTVSVEGKTAMALNLAYTAASRGKKVLLIDGYMRKSEDGADPEPGLADVAQGRASWADVVHLDEESGVYLTGSGRPEGKVASLLSRREIAGFLDTAREKMDLILIDTPPCGVLSDPAILAERADGVLYVVRYDMVQKRRIFDGISTMEDTGVKLLGYVFNAIPVHGGGYGYYGYGRYGYGYYGYGRYHYGHGGYTDRYGGGSQKESAAADPSRTQTVGAEEMAEIEARMRRWERNPDERNSDDRMPEYRDSEIAVMLEEEAPEEEVLEEEERAEAAEEDLAVPSDRERSEDERGDLMIETGEEEADSRREPNAI